ncbi:MAG: ferritin-like domain-containing protein [Candidatus Rokubacteria bacterium]|nr:ferritin-like domain-containing protein [Candidatus Rokubacteria bacterium]
MIPRAIPAVLTTVFEYDYAVQAPDMRSLYEKAKRDQWNAARDIDWSVPEPGDGRILADELVDIHGSPLWQRLAERDRVALNRAVAAWRLSVLLYGEQGAMLACSQLVDIVAGADRKFFQATQVMDEARHNEVLERYLQARLDGRHYPMPDNERLLFDAILTDSRWYIKTIALQLVAETFAVSLFRMMAECARDPLLSQICRRILADESRHMGFGMLALPEVVREASATERREMEDFTGEALEKVLTGFFPIDAYRDLGFSAAEIEEIRAHRRSVAMRNDQAVFRRHFRRDMHAAMVSNLARIGLLTERIRPRLAALGVALPLEAGTD